MGRQNLFGNVIIIGTGLIGASVGLNLISKRMASHVMGVGRGEGNLRAAKKLKAIHSYLKIKKTTDLFSGKGGPKLTSSGFDSARHTGSNSFGILRTDP